MSLYRLSLVRHCPKWRQHFTWYHGTLTFKISENSTYLQQIISILYDFHLTSWWCHDIEMVYALLALCEGNPPQVAGWFPLRSTSNTSFGISFLVELNTLFNKQSSCQWSETPWHSCDFIVMLPSHLDQSCGPPLVGPWLTTCIHMDNQEFPAHNGTHYSPLSSQYPTNYWNTSNRRLTEISLLSSHIYRLRPWICIKLSYKYGSTLQLLMSWCLRHQGISSSRVDANVNHNSDAYIWGVILLHIAHIKQGLNAQTPQPFMELFNPLIPGLSYSILTCF